MIKIGQDKIFHMTTCFLILMSVTAISLHSHGKLAAILLGAGISLFAGVAKELFDKWRGEKFDWVDVLADVAGIAIGIMICLIAIR